MRVRRSYLAPVGVALAIAIAAGLGPRRARADEPPVTVSHGLSSYEQETLAIAEHDHHLVPDPSPEGKIVEAIEYARFDVIDQRDPLPEWVDIFHATTATAVLGREVLQPVGAPFRQYLADETERNLRTYAQLSVVLLRAERGSRPDRVKLLLVTKDVWSLRLNWDLGFGQGGLQFLNLQTTEINLAGTLQSVSATFNELPKSVLYGVSYSAPRLDGHWLRFGADASVIVNRDTGSAEGTAGSVHLARPLFSTRTEWSWGVGSSWVVDVARRYINTDVAQYQQTGGAPTVPWEWNERNFTETAAGTRSFGVRNKDDVTLGFEMNVRDYRYPTGTRGCRRRGPVERGHRPVPQGGGAGLRYPGRPVPAVAPLQDRFSPPVRRRLARPAGGFSPRARHLPARVSGHRGARLDPQLSSALTPPRRTPGASVTVCSGCSSRTPPRRRPPR